MDSCIKYVTKSHQSLAPRYPWLLLSTSTDLRLDETVIFLCFLALVGFMLRKRKVMQSTVLWYFSAFYSHNQQERPE